MSTNSRILILNKDDSLQSIYCHRNGNLSYLGNILYNFYGDVDKVRKMISLGNVSVVGKEIEIPNGIKHSFKAPAPDISIFYDRDRGEHKQDAITHKSLKDFIELYGLQEYNYIFREKNKTWYLLNEKTKKLQKLSSVLLKDNKVSQDIKKKILFDIKKAIAEREANKLNKVLAVKTISNKKTMKV